MPQLALNRHSNEEMVLTALFLVLLASRSTSNALFLPLNVSHFILSPALASPPGSPLFSPPFLEDVVRAIAKKEQWDPSGEVRVLDVDTGDARVGSTQRCELHVRLSKRVLVLELYEDAVSWREPGSGAIDFGPDVAGDGDRVGS